MDKWTNNCARIDLPADVMEPFVDALMEQKYEFGIVSTRVGTLQRVEVTTDAKYVSKAKLTGAIEKALNEVESLMTNELDAAYVTYWEEHGYAPGA